MTDWLALCRAAVDDVRGVLLELPGRSEREPVVGRGMGGDETTAIDAAAESVILARFAGLDATIVSEEAGIRGDGKTYVVVDPIDGSLNAKRGIALLLGLDRGRLRPDDGRRRLRLRARLRNR